MLGRIRAQCKLVEMHKHLCERLRGDAEAKQAAEDVTSSETHWGSCWSMELLSAKPNVGKCMHVMLAVRRCQMAVHI